MVMPSQPAFLAPYETGPGDAGIRVVAQAAAPTPDLAAAPKRRSFAGKYKLRILEETDRAADTGSISAVLPRTAGYLGKACIHRPKRLGL